MNVKNLTISACFILWGEKITMTKEAIISAVAKDNKERTKIRGNGDPVYGRPGYKEHLWYLN